ncbi:enoyl-CoA hydratase-related protein, partial [Klebsiella quasipneumoniae]|uniref:enoyl-CoA hydratase-related protein n=1 Tax=Klebsiella quasipneumoniae TaxID=1463165 RepID=UPI0027308FB2
MSNSETTSALITQLRTSSDGTGITTVTIDYAPVNAIPSKGWFELADAILDAGKDLNTHVVILRAEGRGFNAGVDIKEMQA